MVIYKDKKYTVLDNNVNKQIEDLLNIVVKEILSKIDGIESIILGGSFGKGEGGVEIRNGKAIPLNDFDMFVVARNKIPEDLLNRIADSAVKKLNIQRNTGVDFYQFNREVFSNTFYVDLKSLTAEDLKNLPPMIRYYELKNSGRIIYGKDLLHLIPDYKIDDIPLSEGFRLLLNRLAMLALYFSMDFSKRPMTDNEKYGLLYLGSKIYVDSASALLHLNKKFSPFYLKRTEILNNCYKNDFPKLAKVLPDLPIKVKEATGYKLKLDINQITDPFDFWLEATKCGWEVIKYFGEIYFNKSIEKPEDMAELIYDEMWKIYYPSYLNWYIKNKFKINIRAVAISYFFQRYFNFLVYKHFKKHSKIFYPRMLLNSRGFDLTLYSSMILIIYSVGRDKKIDIDRLRLANQYLSKTFPSKLEGETEIDKWNNVNDAFANAYINFSFLKII